MQPVRRQFAVAWAAFVLGLALPAGAQETPYELNAIVSVTGANAFLGKEELQVFPALEALTNKNGGIRGRPLKIVVSDDQTNPQVAVQLVNGLAAKSVPVILGPGISSTCSSALPLVTAGGPVSYCFSPAVHPPDGSYMFTATVATNDLVTAMMRYLHARGLKRIALITATDATGQDVSRQLEAVLQRPENTDLQLVAHEYFSPTEISVAAQMSRVKAANPQVFITTSTGTPFGTLLRGIHDAGIEFPIVSNGANMTLPQMQQYHDYLPRELLFTGDRGLVLEGRSQGAVHAAQALFFDTLLAQNIRPDFGHMLSWDATLLTIEALKKLGPNATAAQIHDYLQGVRGWSGIVGTYDFAKYPQRGVGLDGAIIYHWDVAKGEFAAVSGPGGARR